MFKLPSSYFDSFHFMTSFYRTSRRTLYFFSYNVLGEINLVEIKCKNISSQEVVQVNLSGFDSVL